MLVDRSALYKELSRPRCRPARIIHSKRLALTSGTRLGAYEVTAPIGEGGMGQVYRARDTKLNRDVALKILPDAFARDPDRFARFTREAQTLASLNHSNIGAIYGIEGRVATSAPSSWNWSRVRICHSGSCEGRSPSTRRCPSGD